MAATDLPSGHNKPLNILHLEDSELDHQLVARALAKDALPINLLRVDGLVEFEQALRQTYFDLILSDYRLPGFTALDAWQILQGLPPSASASTSVSTSANTPFVLLSGAIGESAAVAAIQMGMADYLPKSDLRNLSRVIERALEIYHAKLAKTRALEELALSEQRLAQFAQHLQTAVENERAAIAREIHDDIGGSLAAVKLDLAWVERHSADSDVRSHLSTAQEMLQHAIGASQRIMMNLRPAILDQGLYAAIQWLAQSFQRRTGVHTTLTSNNQQLQTSKAVELAAYRSAQEALTNISKYAQCSAVQIDLSDAEGVLTLEVTDNGRGISDTEMLNPTAFGIRGLRERAKAVGGWLDISSKLGAGTTLIFSVPLDGASKTPMEIDFQ